MGAEERCLREDGDRSMTHWLEKAGMMFSVMFLSFALYMALAGA